MKPRSLALAAVALAVLLPSATPAWAATPCKLVTDPAGDTEIVATDSLDIVSADIASNARTVAVVIRLKKWSDIEQTAPTGRTYKVKFKGHGGANAAFLSYMTTPNGSTFNYGYVDQAGVSQGGQGDAGGKIAGNELRVTIAIAMLSSLPEVGSFKPGKRITGIQVSVGRWVGAYATPDYYGGFTEPADVADTTKSYVAGTKSCLRI